MKKITLALVISLISAYSISQSETEKPPKWGISVAVQNSSIGFQVPFWIIENVVIAPTLGAAFSDNFGWELQVGITPRYYLNTNDLRPYLGMRVGAIMDFPTHLISTSSQVNTTDLIGGLNFGGEYFFSNRFSVGLEIQANLIKSDENSLRFGNPGGINFNTGALALINIYF